MLAHDLSISGRLGFGSRAGALLPAGDPGPPESSSVTSEPSRVISESSSVISEPSESRLQGPSSPAAAGPAHGRRAGPGARAASSACGAAATRAASRPTRSTPPPSKARPAAARARSRSGQDLITPALAPPRTRPLARQSVTAADASRGASARGRAGGRHRPRPLPGRQAAAARRPLQMPARASLARRPVGAWRQCLPAPRVPRSVRTRRKDAGCGRRYGLTRIVRVSTAAGIRRRFDTSHVRRPRGGGDESESERMKHFRASDHSAGPGPTAGGPSANSRLIRFKFKFRLSASGGLGRRLLAYSGPVPG